VQTSEDWVKRFGRKRLKESESEEARVFGE
jgi:hypothetical protein